MEKVHSHHPSRIVLVLVAEKPSQCAAVGIVDVAKKSIQMHDMIHRQVDLLVQIVFKIQTLTIDGLYNFIRHGGFAFRKSLLWSTNFKKT